PAVVVIARDLTVERRLQAQIHFADRMMSVGTLAAGVAHEINNPLTWVIANLGFLEEQLRAARGAPASTDELLELVTEARAGADRVKSIVRDLKTFSRPDDGPSKPLDLRQVVATAINMVQNEIRHRARLSTDWGEV